MRTTVKILFFLICAISFRSANAQVLTQPDGILLQLVARDASGNAASVRNVYSKVTLIKTSATGEVVYVESHKTVTMSDGIFTIIIGKGSRISGASSLTAIDWRSDLYFLNLKVAIEPTIPTPGWDPNNEYVDMGTSQMWTVPYAFFANRANIADSAQTISSLLPGSKGGTGVVNDGKTITLDKNFALKGLGNLTFNTSGTTILNLPTSGSLTTTQSADTLFNKTVFSPKLTGTPKAVTPDIASNDSSVATTKFVNSILDLNKNILNTKIDLVASNALTTTNEKVNISDTAAMLNVYKLSMIDKDNYKVTNNAVVTALVADTATLITRLGYKVNAADTAAMLSSRFARDTASLSNRINALNSSAGGDLAAEVLRATTQENLKVNYTDTTAMLNVYKLSMIDKDAYKISNNTVVAALVADTATLITRLGYKVNAADTAAMLNAYRLSMIDKDAYKVSNNTVVAALVADTATLITRLGYKVNAADTAAMLNVYKLSMIDKDAYKVSNDGVVASLVADTATLITRLGYKVNAADTAAMLNTYKLSMIDKDAYKVSNDAAVAANLTKQINDSSLLAAKIVINTAEIVTLANKQVFDSSLLRGLIELNVSTINTNLLKEQTDSSTLASRIFSDSSLLRNLISSNTSDIATHTTNIANNTINIGQNATDIAANTLAINDRVNYTDIPAFLLPYLKKDDTLSMLAVYRAAMIDNNAKIAALITDTASLVARFGFKEDLANKSTDINGDATSDTKYPSVKSVKDFVDNAISQSTPDATTILKGKIQLSGDLTGIAAAPTVNSVGGSSSTTIHTAELLANTATELNTNNAIVKRDASGNFNAGIITAELAGNVTGNVTGALTGNATTATTLAASKSIYGNAFDGSTDLTQVIEGTYGGTGINNGSNTITLGGNILTANSFTMAGNYSTTLTSVGATNITLPTSGTISTLSGTETLTNKTIANATLTGIPTAPTASAGNNSSQIATTAFVLTTTAAATPDATTILKGKLMLAGDLTGSADAPTVKTFAGVNTATMSTINTTVAAATSLNTGNAIVKRDGSGNFNAGMITANLTGNASTATTLASAKTIYGNAFDGSADLTQAVEGTYGGTGVNNGSNTITLGGNILTANSFTTAGNYSTTLTSIGVTDITLPTTGTIATLAGTETLTNKTIVDATLIGIPTAPTATVGTSTTQIATTAFAMEATPNASSSALGKIQLTGDLSGTATSPAVASVGGSAATDIHSAELLANAATNNNSSSTIVKRDAIGNFTAGTITANLLGTATNVTGIVAGVNGGTGVNNTGKTITLGGNINMGKNFITTGTTVSNASDITLKTTGTTNLTLPTTGVLASLDGSENLTNKTINGLTLTPAAIGFSIAGGTISKTISLTDDATISGTNTGDQTISLTGDITGSGSGTFSTTLSNSGVTSGVYGGATSVPTITVDEKGRIISAANTVITGVSSIGSALESGKIIVGDIDNKAAKVDMTGDISIDNNGTTSIGLNKVTTQHIANLNITYDKIQNVSASNRILGRTSAGAGKVEEIATTGTGNVVRAVSPVFTGTPKVPTAAYPSNDSTIASTMYVTTAISNISANSVTGVLTGANGGTGVNNTGKKITLGRNLTTTGTSGSNASDIIFKTTGPTELILPTSGTLATTSDITGSSVNGQSITGVINPNNGGTGIDNGSNTITVGGTFNTAADFTTTGTTSSNASPITLKTQGPTVITLPTAGVLATLDEAETLTNKTIDASANIISGISNSHIASSANIDDTKLATISSAGKVLNTATTATAANTNNAIVARDANGAFIATTITAALTGNATTATKLATPRSIYGNAFDGSAALTGIIASSFGGTGNGFTKFTGPAGLEKTFTLPNANATILTSNALVTVAQGGTGVAQSTQNFVFAGPSTGSSAGAPSFRALTSADLPAGSGSYIGNSTSQQSSANFNISGSGIAGGSLTAGSFVVPNGTGAQFLKADGTLDPILYAASGANTDITSITGLTTALAIDQGGTGSLTRNFVDLTSNEIIAGTKAFSDDLLVNGITVGKGQNTSISTNTVLGKDALASALTGAYNTAIGYKSLNANTTGSIGNTAVGANALYLNTGQKNTAVGEYALTAVVSGTDNTAVGDYALKTTLGSQNTAIGSGADVATANLSNATAIGYGATVDASNTIQLGNASVAKIKTNGNITAGSVTFPNTHNSTANQVLSIDAAGNATFKTIDGAGTNLTNGKILVGNVSNIATAVNLSGDLTMTNAGATTIANNAVTYGKIQTMGAKTLLGNKLTTTGTPAEITLGTGLSLDATTGILSASVSTGGTLTKILPVTLTTTGSTFTSTVTNSTSTPAIQLTIPMASQTGATAGLLSNTDYAAFFAKQNPLTLGTGVQDFLATPTSANMLTAVSDATGTGALVFASSPTFVTPTLGAATATSLTLATPLSVDNGGIGASTAPANLVFAGPTSGADATPSFRALTGADLPSGSGSYISNGNSQQANATFNISGAGVLGGSLTASSISVTNAVNVANGGTGVKTFPTNSVLIGNGSNAVQGIQPGASGNVLVSNGSAWQSQAAPASGVSVVGSIPVTSNVKGATISGTTITLTPADGTNGGIVTSGAQSFAGTKTFASANVAGGLVGTTVNSTLSGFNAALSPLTADLTISAANATSYNGKVLVCSGSAFTITFDSTVPVGFSCMVLQSDNNTISFSGANNRYNYTATSGTYAIATAMCYASGSVLLTGDLQ